MHNKMRTLRITFLLIIGMILINTLSAQTSKTVNLKQAGSLSSVLNEDEKLRITNLTITGKMDLRDFDVLNEEMSRLTYLDIKGVDIVHYSLESMVFPSDELPSESFMYNKSIKKIILPQSLKVIGSNSFMESYIEEVVLGDNVTIINNGCFSNCEKLKAINIPSSVKHIGKEAFAKGDAVKDELAIEN